MRPRVLMLLAGMMLTTAVAAQQTAPSVPATQDSRPVMQVKTAEEFVKALGPDRILELAPGDYNLTDMKRGVGTAFKWKQAIDEQYELVIRDTARLTIRCSGKEPAHFVTSSEYATVLTFDHCDRLELVNLKLGHAVAKGACMGGVVKALNCNTVRLDHCTLYGSGIHGLEMQKVRQFSFVDSIIEDCSYGILQAEDCEGMHFEKSTFRQCQELYGFDFKDCTKIDFADCTIADNLISQEPLPLLKTNLSDPELAMHMTGGVIRHNAAVALVKNSAMLVLDKTTLEGNAWQIAPQVKKLRGTSTAAGIYTTDLGESSWQQLAVKLFGEVAKAAQLRAANPSVKEPLWPDTKIRLPRE